MPSSARTRDRAIGSPLVRERHDVDALVAERRARAARDALLLVGDDREAAENARTRASSAASGQKNRHHTRPENQKYSAVAQHAGEEHVDDPLVRRLEQATKIAIRRRFPGGQRPAGDAHDSSTRARSPARPGPPGSARFQPGPCGILWRCVVAQRLGERAARADPPAVGALAEVVDRRAGSARRSARTRSRSTHHSGWCVNRL